MYLINIKEKIMGIKMKKQNKSCNECSEENGRLFLFPDSPIFPLPGERILCLTCMHKKLFEVQKEYKEGIETMNEENKF